MAQLTKAPIALEAMARIAKAIAYGLNRWDGLVRFLDHIRLSMTNNPAERGLSGITIGCHN